MPRISKIIRDAPGRSGEAQVKTPPPYARSRGPSGMWSRSPNTAP